jgi:hypothetical protein
MHLFVCSKDAVKAVDSKLKVLAAGQKKMLHNPLVNKNQSRYVNYNEHMQECNSDLGATEFLVEATPFFTHKHTVVAPFFAHKHTLVAKTFRNVLVRPHCPIFYALALPPHLEKHPALLLKD